jgi:hypothetical protein
MKLSAEGADVQITNLVLHWDNRRDDTLKDVGTLKQVGKRLRQTPQGARASHGRHDQLQPPCQPNLRRRMVNAQTPPKVEPLADALQDTKQATESVKEAAEDLAVIHAVLNSELPAEVRQGDAGAAVDQTKNVEKQLGESAELLEQAKEKLQREIKKRKATARKRKST